MAYRDMRQRREYQREYYQKNRENRLEQSHKYREENRVYVREYMRKYREENREHFIKYNREYQSKYRAKHAAPEGIVFLYLVSENQNNNKKRYKIGITRNMFMRMKDLRCGNPDPMKEEYAVIVHAGNARTLELGLHEMYSQYRINGEWFEFDDLQACNVIKQLNKMGDDSALDETNTYGQQLCFEF